MDGGVGVDGGVLLCWSACRYGAGCACGFEVGGVASGVECGCQVYSGAGAVCGVWVSSVQSGWCCIWGLVFRWHCGYCVGGVVFWVEFWSTSHSRLSGIVEIFSPFNSGFMSSDI